MNATPQTLHATALVIGEAGVLLRGRSGAGKSALAGELTAAAGAAGLFARLVGDDRVIVEAAHERLVARPHPAIKGVMERRFSCIAAVAHENGAVVRLAVDLVDRDARRDVPARMPEDEARTAEIAGVRLARLAAPIGEAGLVRLILDRLQELSA